MNSRIPFEVVNSNSNLPSSFTQTDSGIDQPTFQVERVAIALEASEVSAEVPVTESQIKKSAKRVRAKKIDGFDIEADLAAVDQLANSAAGTQSEIEASNETTATVDSEGSDFESNRFEEFNLLPAIVVAIENAGYSIPTPIQVETIPQILAGRDIIGRAETGSGKTAAFACPLLSMINVELKSPQVLVLAPTRELAIQVTNSFEKYGAELAGFKAVTIYGGQSYEIQNNALRRGVQVVVGTPGRIMDHLRQGTLKLDSLKSIVLDEGDEMLRMGFIDDVEWILQQIPSQRQTLLFSATMPAPIQKIANQYLRKPINISIETETAAAESIFQSCVLVQPRTKIDMLAQILESEETDGVIVFVKTRDTTITVADRLSQRGFSAAPLNGEIPQNQRERTIEHLKSGRLNVLVATDVAARGLDVQRISHVINFDFPHDTEAYIHRIGRTGRAGREGAAILFVEPKEQGKLKRLQRETNQNISAYRQKSLNELNQLRIQRFKSRIAEALDDKSLAMFGKIIEEYQQESQAPLEQIAAALAVMAQGDVPLLLKEVVNPRTSFKKDSESKGKRYQGEMTTYRVEVGRNHGVGPGNLVGAITNEAGLDYASIGRIKLFDDFSIIDLPSSLSSKVISELRKVEVSGRELRIERDRRSNRGSLGADDGPRERKPRRRPFSAAPSGRSATDVRDKRSSESREPKSFPKKSKSREFNATEGFSKRKQTERSFESRSRARSTSESKERKSGSVRKKFIKVRGSK